MVGFVTETRLILFREVQFLKECGSTVFCLRGLGGSDVVTGPTGAGRRRRW